MVLVVWFLLIVIPLRQLCFNMGTHAVVVGGGAAATDAQPQTGVQGTPSTFQQSLLQEEVVEGLVQLVKLEDLVVEQI